MRTACLALGTEGLPLAPATAVVRTLVEAGGTRAVTELLPGADGLLRLLPELSTAGDEPGGQARLLELFRALLRRLAADRPLVYVIDDLQWADRSTRDLIDLLVRTLRSAPLLLATAYRLDDVGRGHPLRPYLAELARVPGVRRVELEPLPRAETAQLLTGVLGQAPAPEVLDQIYRRSGGSCRPTPRCTRRTLRRSPPNSATIHSGRRWPKPGNGSAAHTWPPRLSCGPRRRACGPGRPGRPARCWPPPSTPRPRRQRRRGTRPGHWLAVPRISLEGEAEPAAAGPHPLGLTEREAEVLRLIALGRSNRQIGEALFISPKTVSVHVSDLLGKLGAANRSQAAAIAHRLRLLDDDRPTHEG